MIDLINSLSIQINYDIVIAIVAVLVPIFIYFAQKKHKELSYIIDTKSSLIPFKDNIEGNLRVFYNDIQVSKLDLIVFTINNSGRADIESKDYERPLSFFVGEKAIIIDHDIVDTDPDNLSIECKAKGNKIIFTPCLLNKGESFGVKLLITDHDGELQPDGRIKGIKKIKQQRDPKKIRALIVISTLFLGLILSRLFNNESIFGYIGTLMFSLSILYILIFQIYDLFINLYYYIKSKLQY